MKLLIGLLMCFGLAFGQTPLQQKWMDKHAKKISTAQKRLRKDQATLAADYKEANSECAERIADGIIQGGAVLGELTCVKASPALSPKKEDPQKPKE